MIKTTLFSAMLAFRLLFSAVGDDAELITNADIMKENPAVLFDYLSKKAGVTDSGGVITMRWMPMVAVYLDGTPFSSSVTAINSIRPVDVEKIEIYRGASSSKFGASALGGAIAIFKKKNGGKPETDIIAEINSLSGNYVKAISGQTFGDYNLRVSAEEGRINKYFILDNKNSPFKYDTQLDESYNVKKAGNLIMGYSREGLKTDAIISYEEQLTNLGRPNRYRDSVYFNPKLLAQKDFDNFTVSAIAAYEKLKSSNVFDKGGLDAAGLAPDYSLVGDYENSNFQMKLSGKKFNIDATYAEDTEINTGQDHFNGNLLFGYKDRIEKKAVAASLFHNFFNKAVVEISGRFDMYRYHNITVLSDGIWIDKSDVNLSSFNPKISFKWIESNSFTIKTSVGTGFVPPATSYLFLEYKTALNSTLANPNLRPEKSLTFDLGVEGQTEHGIKGSIVAYSTRWTDKMEAITISATPSIAQVWNIGESEGYGVETSVEKTFQDGLRVVLNHTYSETRIKSAAEQALVGNRLAFSPKNRINFSVYYDGIPNLSMRMDTRFETSQFVDTYNKTLDENGYQWFNGEYYTVDLTAIKKMEVAGTMVDLTFGAQNILDRKFQKYFFERDAGRIFRLGVSARF